MIKVNDRFSIRRDSLQWIVTETYDGTDQKTKQAKQQTRDTYHANLEQCASWIIDKMAGKEDCKDLKDLIAFFKIAVFRLAAAVESQMPKKA